MNFKALREYVSGICERYGVPAWDLSVMKDHEEVFRMMDGHSDPDGAVPVSSGDLYWIYSTSKPLTCTAAMRLVEAGVISLEDEVAKFLPEFGKITVRTETGSRPASGPMRIRHLLTMTSGLEYDLDTPEIRSLMDSGSGDTVAFMSALAHKPLEFDPGEGYQYSLSHDVLGAVIERASGMRFGEYLRRNLFEPLGMRHTGFRPDEEEAKRFSTLYEASEEALRVTDTSPALRWPYESGGGGLFSCTDDYRIFADAMAHKGLAANGYRLLRPETVDDMRKNRTRCSIRISVSATRTVTDTASV